MSKDVIRRHLGDRQIAPALSAAIEAMLDDVRERERAALTLAPSDAPFAPSRTWDPEGGAKAQAVGAAAADRYEVLDLIGRGGMGEVYRVRDRVLDRTLALKIALPAARRVAFDVEARITARLDHPGIVPVHDLGTLPDGRRFYTMKEVTGRSLREMLVAVHAASVGGGWMPSPEGWDFRGLIEALRSACAAVGYAHAREVLHRDLKPANILVGTFGEVFVVDWGLARAVGAVAQPTQVVGSPAYMPMEQAAGDGPRVGAASDVHALGVSLFEILHGSLPPLQSGPIAPRLRAILEGGEGRRRLPPELVRLCLWAVSERPEDRPADAGQVARALGAWLTGAERLERALELVERADELRPNLHRLRGDAAFAVGEAREAAARLAPDAGVVEKRPVWALEDQGRALELRADEVELSWLQLLSRALERRPELPQAHARLAAHYRDAHARAERAGRATEAARQLALLRSHDTGEHAAYLRGQGHLSLVSRPCAAAHLYRYVARDRRLVLEFVRELGPTPVSELVLPMGSWLVELHAPGHHALRYPVHIGRLQGWDCVPPGGERPRAIRLLPLGSLGPDELFVPAGWFRSGDDAPGYRSLPARRLWLDDFVVQRTPVTNRQYIAFLNDLIARGDEAAALEHVPRERSGARGRAGAVIYGRGPDGGFHVREDVDGDQWLDQWPVMMIGWWSMVAYGRWLAARSGLAWRLPTELEWEKAARGVDGRAYPWGDHAELAWARVRSADPALVGPAPVGVHPIDESPYGALDMGGNVREWCAEAFQTEGVPVRGGVPGSPPEATDDTMRVDRGGSWAEGVEGARATSRDSNNPMVRSPYRGFRLVRSV